MPALAAGDRPERVNSIETILQMGTTVSFEAKNLTVDQLKEKAVALRKLIIKITTEAGSGHPSSSLSAVEVVTALFFGDFMKYDEASRPGKTATDLSSVRVTLFRFCIRQWPKPGTSRPSRL